MFTDTSTLTNWITGVISISPEKQRTLLMLAGVIALLWLLRTILIRVVMWKTQDPRTRYTWRKTISYFTVALILALITRILFRNIQSLATVLGLFTAALTIALKDLVINLAGWFFILWRRPFGVGDRIQINEQSGDVIDIRMFHFTLMEIGNWVNADQSTGRIIHIPNGRILSESLGNYSQGFHFIWNEIPVQVTFESNWKKAKDILLGIANKHTEHLSTKARTEVRKASEKYMIFYKNLTPTVYTSVQDSGIMLTIRYLSEPRRRRGSEEKIWEDILTQFTQAKDIDFAYPTVRYFDNTDEGKSNNHTTH